MMSKVGKVISLYISIKGSSAPLGKQELFLDEQGIVNDKHYNTDTERSVLITSMASYDILTQHQIETDYGILGENLLIDYNPYTLRVGTKLQIGSAILQISQNCTLCNHLSKVDKRIPKLLKNDRGVFGKVLQSGSIKVEDEIFLLD